MSEPREFVPIRIAVLTVSDTRKLEDDRSGDILVGRIKDAGHMLAVRRIIQDERDQVADQLRAWCKDKSVDVISSSCQATKARGLQCSLHFLRFS